MLKWILLGLGGVIVVFLIIVALQPADFKVERSATLRAPAPAAFAQVNDFQNWRAWSPWEKLDPQMNKTFEGPAAGSGSNVNVVLLVALYGRKNWSSIEMRDGGSLFWMVMRPSPTLSFPFQA